jgi:two-component system cell cycle response regulator DivK
MTDKIMVVEDNPQNMRLFEMVLRNEDYTLLKATDGEEALAMALEKRPDLILMDISLPGMSGLEVTRRLRKDPSFANTPIIGITAYAMKGDREKVIESGCDIYMSKPVNTLALPEVIAELLVRSKKSSRQS